MPYPWPEFARAVLALYCPPLRRIATYRKMRQVLEEFGAICPMAGDLTPAMIARWIVGHPERRPETTAALLRTLRAACSYGLLSGAMPSTPFAFRTPNRWVDWDVPDLPPPVHTGEEIARVLARADTDALAGCWRAERLRALVYTLAYTGARKREVLGLRIEDVDLTVGAILIRTNRRRGLKTRASASTLPVAPELHRVLEHWMPLAQSEWLFPGVRHAGPWLEGPVGSKAIHQVEALGIRAGVEGLTIASFRHTFASLSESWGLSELELQRVLRHSNRRTQTYYRHPLPEVLRAAAEKVRYQRESTSTTRT